MSDGEHRAPGDGSAGVPGQDISQHSTSQTVDGLVSDILSGKVSMFDLLRSAPSGDYWAFIQRMRLFHVLSRDLRVLKVFQAELSVKITEAGIHNDGTIEKELVRKDGPRRFPKLLEARAQLFTDQPSLLSGTNFEESLEQYKALIAHVENMWAEACHLHAHGSFPLATFLSILVIEETGKLARLSQDLIFYDTPRPPASGAAVDRSHRRKHFIAVMSGALINARLDRVLGKDVVRKMLHLAESDELEKIRQSCLYIDIQNSRAVIPSEAIDAEQARILTVLAGEIMMEVLGHFPWEFERMRDNVIAFERSIGMPEARIDPASSSLLAPRPTGDIDALDWQQPDLGDS
jgi:AbiV family abortive infection protein